jgi:hypothetical protein
LTISTISDPARRPPRAALSSAPPPQDAETASRATKWAIALFFVALCIPGSLYIGVRMTPYRAYLIAMAVPMVLRFRADPTIRLTVVDVLVFLAIFWRAVSLVAVHKTGEVFNAGSTFIELFFGYMLGRVYIRSAADYRWFFRCFLVALLVMLPFVAIEAVAKVRLMRRIAGVVLTPPPEVAIDGAHMRFGLLRAQGPFDHALLYGTFCAIGFANMYYLHPWPRNLVFTAFTGFMALFAISSSSILTLGMQMCMIAYESVLRRLRGKWVIAIVAILALWFSFEILTGLTPVDYVVSKLVLNPTGAEGRLDQIRYGVLEIQRHPIFGIGLNPAALPFWRGDVFDNFWLHTAVRFGLPALFFIAAAFLAHFLKIAFSPVVEAKEEPVRSGYQIAFVAMAVIIGGLSLWGVLVVFIMLYFGAGAWLYDRPGPAPRRAAARMPSPAAPAAPQARPSAPAALPNGPLRPGLGGRPTRG